MNTFFLFSILIGHEWLLVYHNDENFEKDFAQQISNLIEIENNPVKLESIIVKIIDFD